MTNELWRKFNGTTAEEVCAAIRELWLAKSPNYIRMLNEVPNRLIGEYAIDPEPSPSYCHDPVTGRELDKHEAQELLRHRYGYCGRQLLKDLEKFLTTQPFADHFSDNPLEDELFWKEPDAPLSDYVEADKKRDALIQKYSLKNRATNDE
jgi:hypothetical protein